MLVATRDVVVYAKLVALFDVHAFFTSPTVVGAGAAPTVANIHDFGGAAPKWRNGRPPGERLEAPCRRL